MGWGGGLSSRESTTRKTSRYSIINIFLHVSVFLLFYFSLTLSSHVNHVFQELRFFYDDKLSSMIDIIRLVKNRCGNSLERMQQESAIFLTFKVKYHKQFVINCS